MPLGCVVQSFAMAVSWSRIYPYVRRAFYIAILLAFMLVTMAGSSLPPALEARHQVRAYTRNIEFDYVGWIADALWLKFLDFSLGASDDLTTEARRKVVVEYLQLAAGIQQLEWEIRTIYADPNIDEPQKQAAELTARLAQLQSRNREIAPYAESVLQDQVNSAIVDVGLDVGGQAVPPVMYHSTPLPLALIISPRDEIRQVADISLIPDLPIEAQVALEERVDGSLDVSSLVVNIGGVGVYPTMVMRTSDMPWLSEVVAHEWVHNYLTLRPLGMSYLNSPELRIMNETVASIAGKEIGRRVLERYYPELLPKPPAEPQVPTTPVEPEEPVFDFRREMHTTRLKVDELLAAGQVDEAETYMEARRKDFWEQGYHGLRKLNQAYFAFHGAYADEPVGAAGADPVGAAVRKLRAESGSLAEFLERISWVTDFAQLQEMVADGP